MEEQNKIEVLIKDSKEYINTVYELSVLKASEKTANLASQFASFRIIGVFFVISVLLLSIAAAFYISAMMDKNAIGFLIVGGFYLFVGIFLFLFRKGLLMDPIRNKIIQEMFKQS